MKKTSHTPRTKKKVSPKPKEIITPELPDADNSVDEENLAGEQFSVVGREEEASSSGHRVEPIQPDEEGNAQTLIEDGLHGYLHANGKKSRQAR